MRLPPARVLIALGAMVFLGASLVLIPLGHDALGSVLGGIGIDLTLVSNVANANELRGVDALRRRRIALVLAIGGAIAGGVVGLWFRVPRETTTFSRTFWMANSFVAGALLVVVFYLLFAGLRRKETS